MTKRLQNRLSESKLTLPVAAILAVVVWLLSGLIGENRWVSFACFVLTTYLMIELNNSNSLIRIYSRMVSTSFLTLSCVASFLFASWQVALVQTCLVATLSLLFHSYQDKESVTFSYYAYLCLGIGSLCFVQSLWFLPLLWLLHGLTLQSLSWRTFATSILGLLTPYWMLSCWCVWQEDFSWMEEHFLTLSSFGVPMDFSMFGIGEWTTLGLLAVVSGIGIVHYLRTSYLDRIRVRQLYHFFIWSDLVMFLSIMLQPQLYAMLTGMLIVFASPLIAHYLALTKTRVTDIVFHVLLVACLLLTVMNLLIPTAL